MANASMMALSVRRRARFFSIKKAPFAKGGIRPPGLDCSRRRQCRDVQSPPQRLWRAHRHRVTHAVLPRANAMKTSLRRHYPDQVQGLEPRAPSQPAGFPAPLVVSGGSSSVSAVRQFPPAFLLYPASGFLVFVKGRLPAAAIGKKQGAGRPSVWYNHPAAAKGKGRAVSPLRPGREKEGMPCRIPWKNR